MSAIKKYIIVDDDPNNNMICNIMIEMVLGKVDIETFEMPERALTFLQNGYSKTAIPCVLFLDINMPTITGWEFLKRFEKFSEKIKNQISIYILSSSIDQHDKDKAEAKKYVKGFISKPLTRETILSVANV